MTFEQLVGDALHAADDYEPSPDLFAKVQRSIDEDAAHRRRVRRVIIWLGVAVAAVLAYLALTVDVVDGSIIMSFRALEILVTAVMIALVAVLGPAIRRFGETYEQAVFSARPETGARVLRLLDIAYYLVFGAYILMTLVFDPTLEFGGTLADWVRAELVRVGGLLLIMGVLHVALLLALPIAGLVFSANQRQMRLAEGAVSTDPLAGRVDRVITIGAWIIAGLAVLQMLGIVLNVVLLGAGG
ncbi:MAG: hypothetical protein OER93_09095 [Thermoleophilia bacterium]|nr:hypothetical protein [Thermoleophilia bacterium]